MSRTSDPLAYSVDMTEVIYRYTANDDGTIYPSARRKLHRHRDGDCLAVCSSRVLTNWPDEHGIDPAMRSRNELCRRCFPGGSES